MAERHPALRKIITFGEFSDFAKRDGGYFIYPNNFEDLPRETLGVMDFNFFQIVSLSDGAKQSLSNNPDLYKIE